MKKTLTATLIILGVAGFTTMQMMSQSEMTAKSEKQTSDDANTVIAAGQLNDQWKQTFDKTGNYPVRQDPGWHRLMYGSLIKIQQDSPNYPEARRLLDDFAIRQLKIDAKEREKRIAAIINDAVGRKQFADQIERNFLKDGRDMRVKAYGSKNTTLELDYILIDRPFVYKVTNETTFLGDAWNAGFRKVMFRGRLRGAPWIYEVPKDWKIAPRL